MDALIIFSFIAVIVVGIVVSIFIIYRRGLRFAKSIERGIKMVPILISLPPSSEDAEVGGRDVRDVIQERISQAEVLYNLIASTATKGFKSKFFGQRHVGFEIVAIDGVIRFYAAVPVALVSVVKQAILTAYPGAQLDEVEDHNVFSESGKLSGTYGGDIKLKQPYSYPIATANELKRDAMQAIIKSLTNLEHGDGASLQILIRPAREGWTKASNSLVKKKREEKGSSSGGASAKALLQAPFKPPESSSDKDQGSPPKQLTSMEQATLDAIEQKTKSSGYETIIRVVASSGTANKSQSIVDNIVSSFSLFDAPGLNGFKFQPAKNMEKFVTDFIFRFFPPEQNRMILNSVELASLFHFPDDQFSKTTQIQRQSSKQVEGPSRISDQGLVLGHNLYHGVKKEIRLSDEDRRRHVYIVGQTGTGKSTMLENLMVQDMNEGKGFAFIDPHGDTAEKMLGMVPHHRSEDVIYFDPGDLQHPLGLNIFEYHSEDQKDFLIQEAINMLYRLYDPQHTGIIGPRYEHLFRNAALTVMAGPDGGTFVDIPKLFTDPQYVKQKLKYVEDQSVREFWQKEMPQSQRSNDFGEVVSWFVSKFGAFLSNQLMRNTIGQTKSAFDLRDLMDSNKILIANLSKGRLGELNSQLLGMIFVMKFQAAAMSRASVPEDQRKDFSLYVDEFQNFSTESFAFILSEARKYRMNLIVANQFISQLSEEVRDAVFGNVGTILSYRTGPADADFLVKQFAPAFSERDLVNLPNFNAAIRLMSSGLPTQPFNIAALPPLASNNPQVATALKQLSAAKHARPRAEVEKEIFDRLSVKPAPSPFDSLASTTKSTQSQSPSAPAPSSGDGSFLDEWLAKRKQTLAQQKATQKEVPASQNPKGATGPTPSIQKAPSPPQSNFAVDKHASREMLTDNARSADPVETPPNASATRSFLDEKKPKDATDPAEGERALDTYTPPAGKSEVAQPSFSEASTRSHFSQQITPPEKETSVTELVSDLDEPTAQQPAPQQDFVFPEKTTEDNKDKNVHTHEEGSARALNVAPKASSQPPPEEGHLETYGGSEPKEASYQDTGTSLDGAGKSDKETPPTTGSKDKDEASPPVPNATSDATKSELEASGEDAPLSGVALGTSSSEPSGKEEVDTEGSLTSIGASIQAGPLAGEKDNNHMSESDKKDHTSSLEETNTDSIDEEEKDKTDAGQKPGDQSSESVTPSTPLIKPEHKTPIQEDKDDHSESDDATPDTSDDSEVASPPPAVDPAIANLKPGEVYIDDEGNIHQG